MSDRAAIAPLEISFDPPAVRIGRIAFPMLPIGRVAALYGTLSLEVLHSDWPTICLFCAGQLHGDLLVTILATHHSL